MRTVLISILLLAGPLLAEEAKPNTELDAAKARIIWLEQKYAMLEGKSSMCFDALNGVFTSIELRLNNLSNQEPPKPAAKPEGPK